MIKVDLNSIYSHTR